MGEKVGILGLHFLGGEHYFTGLAIWDEHFYQKVNDISAEG